ERVQDGWHPPPRRDEGKRLRRTPSLEGHMKGAHNRPLLLTALVVASVSLATGASAAQRPWPSCSATKGSSVEMLMAMARGGDLRSKLFANICGPHRVIRGVNYSYTVVVTNIGDVN